MAYHGLESDHSGFISAQLHSSLTANLVFVPLLSSFSCYLQMVVRGQISQPWWQFLLFYLHGVGFDFLRMYSESSSEAMPLILLMLYKMPLEESLSDPLAYFKMLKFISSLIFGYILPNRTQ